ncbi:MAG: glycogen/starch/alpha-glucan phosphorylase [Thioalkalivibrio sp.]|nr:glycogen/starch/alpha-glucan phosphorylase [Thioalkalivibrio sp.]
MTASPDEINPRHQLSALACDSASLRQSIRDALVRVVGKDPDLATPRDWLHAVSFAIRERIIERRVVTRRQFAEEDVKRVYYLSMEYLIGRMLEANLRNMGIFEATQQALKDLGVDFRAIARLEEDAALGNGGLGRLAACILESMATQGYPGYGYGIRYEFGMFQQHIEHCRQVEHPDNWLRFGNPWEFPRELRLKQEYFFVSASLQDIFDRNVQLGYALEDLPDKAAIQLNDTHPAIAVAEFMRLLVDEHRVPWHKAWDITRRVFAYTNHTLMPEALETWPVALMERVLPRHMLIIYRINHEFIEEVRHRFPGDHDLLRRLSIIDEEHGRRVRMAHLAVVGSHKVNGVAALHTNLLKQTLFADFDRIWPERFINVTNGVTPRLWMIQANPGLTALIESRIGSDWKFDLDRLAQFTPYASDEATRAEFRAIKRGNKERLAGLVAKRTGVVISPDVMYDVQIKRIHEYKRQLLKLLHVIELYQRIRDGEEVLPRVVLFAGKAAPGYQRAKDIIEVINEVADIVNNDPLVGDRLKCVFFPNYEVSSAAIIIPAADLSQQISTAGFEASGTGNMKLALNGALTIGTLDGANIEIRDAVGAENIFIFGMTANEVSAHRAQRQPPSTHLDSHPRLRGIIDALRTGFFANGGRALHAQMASYLLEEDPFFVLADYAAYSEACTSADILYEDIEAWSEAALLNVARMNYFSIDRTVRAYAENIWYVVPEPVQAPCPKKPNEC